MKVCATEDTEEHDYMDIRFYYEIQPLAPRYSLRLQAYPEEDLEFFLRLGADPSEEGVSDQKLVSRGMYSEYFVELNVPAESTNLSLTFRTTSLPLPGVCVFIDETCLQEE